MKPHPQQAFVWVLILFLIAGCAGQPTAIQSENIVQPYPTSTLPAETAVPTPTPVPPLPWNCAESTDAGGGLHILFIGNSLTYTNDLPGMFTVLACAGGGNVTVDMRAVDGVNLGNHLSTPATLEKLQQKWDIVVLQEYDQIAYDVDMQKQMMFPAIRKLDAIIRKNGARTLLFENWTSDGKADMNHTMGIPYADRQKWTNEGFDTIAAEIKAEVAPVGKAWLEAATQPEPIQIWSVGGFDASEAGTYLAACVFYATIFDKSPVGLPTIGKVDPKTAEALQVIAAQAVGVK